MSEIALNFYFLNQSDTFDLEQKLFSIESPEDTSLNFHGFSSTYK